MIQQAGYNVNLGELFKGIITASGLSNWEKILVKTDPQAQANPMMNPAMNPMANPMAQMPQAMPQAVPQAMPQMAQQETPQIDPDELKATMETYQIDAPTAETVIVARRLGYDEKEIATYLRGGIK